MSAHFCNSRIRPLANDFVTVCESPSPATLFCYTPGLACTDDGRLIATMDFGGPGQPSFEPQGRIFISDDNGMQWCEKGSFPFIHARPFIVGGVLYVIGHADTLVNGSGDLMIMRSDDRGETWGTPVRLTHGQEWHQSACNVWFANECVYLVMELRVTRDIHGWYPGELAPVLMRASVDADLLLAESWTFASILSFRDVIPDIERDPGIDFFGVPFFASSYPSGITVAPGRDCAPIGWLEANVVQFNDPAHIWHDPSGRTFHLWMRAHTGGTGYAAIAKVVEYDDGTMTTMLETVPSGKKILFIPCPGGHMRFHVIFDKPSGLFWLLGTQATDSMTRPELLSANRYNLPNNERRRMHLYFSKNMVDWCFAGIVAEGASDLESRNYGSMVVKGNDLLILSRSGDKRAASPHNGNLITFHVLRDFRKLVY
ncbi:MAG: exo-alpha-sialidase [Lentisphaerae bacterium]|jgi:hypothetical protein|nr:exo-alpha-sialidase [Lentisphaerota bacterium]